MNSELKIAASTAGNLGLTVTPPTPTDPFDSSHLLPSPSAPFTPQPTRTTRKDRSGSLSNVPSKLSQSMTMPLTPTAEGGSTSGTPIAGIEDPKGGTVTTTITAGNGASGGGQSSNATGSFFQSMFSAAQNAATTLSNTVANNIAKGDSRNGSGSNTPDVARSRSGTETGDTSRARTAENNNDPSGVLEARKEEQPRRKLAVETLGRGELTLGTFGILPNPRKADLNRTSVVNASGPGEAVGPLDVDVGGNRNFTDSISRTRTLPAINTTGDGGNVYLASHTYQAQVGEPKTPLAEDATFSLPPNGQGNDNEKPTGDAEHSDWAPNAAGDMVRRSGSARSNRGAGPLYGHARRHRGSSAASSLAGHLQSPNSQMLSLPSPASTGTGPKVTGFAVASKKRNRDFHALFRSVPEDDYLIEDYSGALQKEILVQGRIYVSEGHICFHANILGWITTLVISFDEVMAIEKKSTAVLFPNAITIQTLHAKNVFASFMSRDTTYDLLVNIWKISHPGLIPSVAGFTLEKPNNRPNSIGDDGIKDGSHSGSESEDEYDEDEEGYDEDDEGFDGGGDDGVDDRAEGGYGEMAGGGVSAPNGAALNATAPDGLAVAKVTDAAGSGTDGAATSQTGRTTNGAPDQAVGQDFPGPPTHPPSDCGDGDLHYEKVVCESYLPGPLGKVYSLLFGPQSYDFMTKFFEDQKVFEVSIPNNGEWAPNPEAEGKKTRNYSYIRPLSGPIGPKQTKCICSDQIEQMDLDKAVSVLITTQTPDVPSGNQFVIKTRYCLTWGDGSNTGSAAETKLMMTCVVEWSGKSWLKGPIEKGCNDGQINYGKDLTAMLTRELEKSAIASRPKAKSGGKGRRGKGGKGATQGPTSMQLAAVAKAVREKAAREKQEREDAAWGIFLPLKPVLEPIVDIAPGGGLGLLGFIGFLLIVILALTGKLPFISGRSNASTGRGGMSRGDFGSGWEHSWYAEEQGLWDWLEDRVGLNDVRLNGIPESTQEGRRSKSWNKMTKGERIQMEKILQAKGSIREREVDEAIKVMERRLEVLREIVSERKGEQDF